MKFTEFTEKDYKIHGRKHLDQYLVKLCRLVFEGKQSDPEKYGMVAACVLDPNHNVVYGVNTANSGERRRHAERVAMDRYVEQYGEIPQGSIIITTLSPCNEDMEERYGESCTDLVNGSLVRKVYCGYIDPSQHSKHNEYTLEETSNSHITEICKKFADTFLKKDVNENFADGKNPGRKGLAKRSGVNTKASVSSLRKTAKHSSGEKQRMSHWLANMRSGRAKKNK
jgi:pyrimidine deaminase RibD-like protein